MKRESVPHLVFGVENRESVPYLFVERKIRTSKHLGSEEATYSGALRKDVLYHIYSWNKKCVPVRIWEARKPPTLTPYRKDAPT